jgi:hypothetical protein
MRSASVPSIDTSYSIECSNRSVSTFFSEHVYPTSLEVSNKFNEVASRNRVWNGKTEAACQ